MTNLAITKSFFNDTKQGIYLLLVGAGIGIVTQFGRKLYSAISEWTFYSIDIDSKDKLFECIIYWLSQQNDAALIRSTNRLNAETTYNDQGKVPVVLFAPSIGKHSLIYKGKRVWIDRVRDSTFDMASGAPFESITLSTMRGNGHLLKQLVQEAMVMSLKRDDGKTVVYINSQGSWERFGHPRSSRSLDSVILQPSLKSQLVKDISDFIANEEWYRNRGIPYRRGYLLYGPPGNGKTSLVNAIAGELNLDICIISLSQKDMDDRQLNRLLNTAPPKSILLIEDIDAAFSSKRSMIGGDDDSNTGSSNSGITYSGLLNSLDGVASQEGRILFMTTNRLQLLDDALIREGRVDLKISIQNATKQQSKELFNHFYGLPQDDNELAIKFSQNIIDYKLSMSRLQGFLLEYRDSPEKAIENIHLLNPVNID
eukprot:gene3100-3877_t